MRAWRSLRIVLLAVGLALASAGCSARQAEDERANNAREALTGEFCGGFAGTLCAEGQTCIDLPDDGCDPANGGHDCIGVCGVAEPEPELRSCGGFAGALCDEGEVCVDDDRDTCDPDDGGSDCLGVCVPAPAPEGNEPEPSTSAGETTADPR